MYFIWKQIHVKPFSSSLCTSFTRHDFIPIGTTWLQEIVYLIHSDLNFGHASRALLDDRFPYFEFTYPGLKDIEGRGTARLIKSHLPWTLLPQSVKEKRPKVWMAQSMLKIIYF